MFQVISNSFPEDFCAMEHGPFGSMIALSVWSWWFSRRSHREDFVGVSGNEEYTQNRNFVVERDDKSRILGGISMYILFSDKRNYFLRL